MFKLLKQYFKNTSGNFALVSAVVAIPLVMAVGFVVDLTTISRSQAELQQAMDAAVLAVAREGDQISDKEAETIVRNFLESNYKLEFANLQVIRKGTAVTIEAKASTDMAFGALLGLDARDVAAASTADIAYAKYEIALVLDTTGSMAGGKLTSMKDAVDGMIESMSAQIKNKDRLKFSLVPFATFVNVGPEFGPEFKKNGKIKKGTGAEWLDLKGKSEIPQLELKKGVSRFEVMHNLGQDWKGCVETRMASKKGEHDVADTEPNKKDSASLFVPAFAMDEPDTGGYGNSYIKSSVDPLDKSLINEVKKLAKYGIGLVGVLPGADDLVGTLLPVNVETGSGEGPGRGCDMQPITPLSNNYATLRSNVKDLNASGTTNIMEGVAWGARVLSPGEPFGQGQPKSKAGVEKIMIVLTDGANNMGVTDTKLGTEYSSFGYLVDERLGPLAASSSATNTAMNERTLAACEYAKKDGIEIYTIRLEEPDVKTGTMLQECATDEGHFFDAPSRTQLDDVFKQIKERVVRLRLAS